MIPINHKRKSFINKKNSVDKGSTNPNEIKFKPSQIYNYKIRSRKYKKNTKNIEMKITENVNSMEVHYHHPKVKTLWKREEEPSFSSLKVEKESTLRTPVILGVTSALFVIIVILTFIIKKTNFCKWVSSFCVKKASLRRHLLKKGDDSTSNDDDKSISINMSNDNESEDDDEVIKLPTPVAKFSSRFNNSPQNSIRTNNSSRYDFLKSKINYLDQDFDNYFKPVHSLFEKDLMDEIGETIKDDFDFNSLPGGEVN